MLFLYDNLKAKIMFAKLISGSYNLKICTKQAIQDVSKGALQL
jgi:hypothetical protein